MIDKIEVMVEAETPFRSDLDSYCRAMVEPDGERDDPYSKVRRSKFYQAVGDLRPLGLDAMLHYDQKRYHTHKIEFFETGKKGLGEIEGTLEKIVDCDPGDCRLGRVDLAADVRDVSILWFRTHVRFDHKQFICEHGKRSIEELDETEMGKRIWQTLYFGKKPSCIRIYDKVAERVAAYELWKRRELREARRAWKAEVDSEIRGGIEKVGHLLLPQFPSVQEWLSKELPASTLELENEPDQLDLLPGTSPPLQNLLHFPVVTRVENQLGGRVPAQLYNIAELRKNVRDFNPFSQMRVIGGRGIPPGLFDRDEHKRHRFSVKDWGCYMFFAQLWKEQGAQATWPMMNRDRNGPKYLRTMREQGFLPLLEDDGPGISETELFDQYRTSVSRQLAA